MRGKAGRIVSGAFGVRRGLGRVAGSSISGEEVQAYPHRPLRYLCGVWGARFMAAGSWRMAYGSEFRASGFTFSIQGFRE